MLKHELLRHAASGVTEAAKLLVDVGIEIKAAAADNTVNPEARRINIHVVLAIFGYWIVRIAIDFATQEIGLDCDKFRPLLDAQHGAVNPGIFIGLVEIVFQTLHGCNAKVSKSQLFCFLPKRTR